MDVPVQYFQSVIAIELAVTGGLLYQIGFFSSRKVDPRDNTPYHPVLRILIGFVISATLLGSLLAIRIGGQELAASLVVVGLAVSVLPILLWVVPPLVRDARDGVQTAAALWGVVGLVVYAIGVAVVIVLILA
ncbi:MAG TPA: hypothetical protein VID03_02380 [Acidimicrobiia bacterium]|jgi:hypothetical protein